MSQSVATTDDDDDEDDETTRLWRFKTQSRVWKKRTHDNVKKEDSRRMKCVSVFEVKDNDDVTDKWHAQASNT